ncbi:MAG TPA: 50S ribosomal protein L20 [Bacteroidetes bacterium]|nr:50S ribosomal protein L20 [Bacteroidota bacterium]
MPRVTNNVASRRRRKRVLLKARGYWGRRSIAYKTAKETMHWALKYAYRDRRTKKRQFRRLWIQRINAASRLNGLSYSKFMAGLKEMNIDLDRKILAELAVSDPNAFSELASRIANT